MCGPGVRVVADTVRCASLLALAPAMMPSGAPGGAASF